MTANDQKPSTSQRCKKRLSPKKSPWKTDGDKVKKFRKIVDGQARKITRRSIYTKNDSQQVIRKVTPRKFSPKGKICKRQINRRKSLQKISKKGFQNISSTVEEGEIRSDVDRSPATFFISTVNNIEDDEDDCIVIEPTLEEITIDDNDDEDFPSTCDVTTNDQSLMDSFEKRVSSTPCLKIKSPTGENTLTNDNDIAKSKSDILPFFVDVGRGTESINSIDSFADYVKLSTLRERSVPKRRSVRLKESLNDKPREEVINLDDTSNESMDITLKHKSEHCIDDSVIFISETNTNDFIPIVDETGTPDKNSKNSGPLTKTPANRMCMNNLFTYSETKKLNEYNENAYNPSTSIVLGKGKRTVIIDGSNVAFKHGLDQHFSVKGLQIAIEYFEKMGHEVKAVIPQFRMNKTKSTNPEELERLHKAGKIVQTPCKNLPGYTSTSYDDRFILQLAFAMDAAIVSNDNYRDLLHENPAFKKIIENRVIGYTWCNDIFILPKDPYGKWGPTLHTILNRT